MRRGQARYAPGDQWRLGSKRADVLAAVHLAVNGGEQARAAHYRERAEVYIARPSKIAR